MSANASSSTHSSALHLSRHPCSPSPRNPRQRHEPPHLSENPHDFPPQSSDIPVNSPSRQQSPFRKLTGSPSRPQRTTGAIERSRNSPSFSSPSTIRQAVETTLPSSPSPYRTPPSLFPSHLQESVELHPLTPRSQYSRPVLESPFDDRNSILFQEPLTTVDDEDPFEYIPDARITGASRQRTMPGYKFSNTSPTSREWENANLSLAGGPLETRPITKARRSLYPPQHKIPITTLEQHPDLLPPTTTNIPNSPRMIVEPIPPTFEGLFALSRPRDILIYLVPAVFFTVIAALLPPYMSMIIGDVFAVLTRYPLDYSQATSADRSALTDGVRENTIKLTAIGGVAVSANYAKGVLWQRHGEVVTDRLRRLVYDGVQNKGMEWFDFGMGMNEEEDDEGETVGAGGLMAKFTRETDDVRMGMSQAMGSAIQYLLTFLACFILGLVKSPVLAIVTLSTIPLVVLVQIVTQVVAVPLYQRERQAFAEASTNVDRATSAIATVKAYNAQQSEVDRFSKLIGRGAASLIKQSMVWAISMSLTDFLLLGTFVLGFWYGAKVVRDGKATPGTVMTVFWACLLAATYLQMVVPQLTLITKAKNSMASLRTVVKDEPRRPTSGVSPFSPVSSPQSSPFPTTKHSKTRPLSLRGLRPSRCRGEFNLKNVSFAYPSRPNNLVLRDVTLFIPPGETTFIVGGSGSGKSTIAQLLLRLYPPGGGEITLDDQSIAYLDESFCRENIAAVQQGCVLFDMSIHDNVAMGLAGAGPDPKTGLIKRPEHVTRQEVVEACKMAMIHEFVEALPQGYDTKLGNGGSALSGGQRQRIAVARARIRDPTVLVLDEATSALDATSRVVVFNSLKSWRKNRTTIVITHDLSQIVPDDFVYVMKDGVVAEQGFRSDLMRKTPLHDQMTGVFAEMAAEQAVEPLPPKLEEWKNQPEDVEEILDGDSEMDRLARPNSRLRAHTPSFAIGGRPESAMYLDILEEYAMGTRLSVLPGGGHVQTVPKLSTAQKRLSWSPSQLDSERASRTSLVSADHHRHSLVIPSRAGSRMSRRISHNASPNFSSRQGSFDAPSLSRVAVASLEKEKDNRLVVPVDHRSRTLSQNLEDDLKGEDGFEKVAAPSPYATQPTQMRGLFNFIFHYFPTIPEKHVLFLGLAGALGHGIATPVWSYFLSKLMAIVGAGGRDTSLTKFGFIVLALSAAQALSDFVQQYCLYTSGAKWTASLKCVAYGKILQQDKGWFDESSNAPSRLVQGLIKDADDMRHITASVMGRIVVFIAMVGMGIIWAMIIDWRLTLIGVALAPAFALLIIVNNYLLGRAEILNKAKREAVARTFFESVSNIRGIRAMALESAFRKQFTQDALMAKRTGKRAGWAVAIGIAASAGLPLFAQALMNYVGSQFMLKGYINFSQMLQVFNLVLFSLTFGTAMLDFIPILAKTKAAARDFERLSHLSGDTRESTGDLRFPITGEIIFSHVGFSYPSRSDVPILRDINFIIGPGECVAVVGPSGSGKSTIAALLQRLYEPSIGTINMGKYDLSRAEPKWLRDHIAVVSQTANLFDATVSKNIAYGSEVAEGELIRAAKAANIHDFIQSLPQGYDTNLGENASLISGGQAQRLQVARALVRRSNILILDECTSALDIDNQRAILDTILKIKESRTTIFITHSVAAMRMCDRVICLGDGVVAEEGTYDELVAKGGVFAHLMQTGEWE